MPAGCRGKCSTAIALPHPVPLANVLVEARGPACVVVDVRSPEMLKMGIPTHLENRTATRRVAQGPRCLWIMRVHRDTRAREAARLCLLEADAEARDPPALVDVLAD